MNERETGDIQSEKEALATGYTSPGLWLKRIQRAKEDEKDWHADARSAVDIYEADESAEGGLPSFNILHSNIEITVPSLYNSTPVPDIRRRYGDVDELGKLAVDIIERALGYTLDQYDFDGTMVEATRDAELVGRGVPRVRYEPRMDGENVGYQETTCEVVTWDKWGHGPARHWAEVDWIYFEHDFTEDDLKALGVGPERINMLAFDGSSREATKDTETEPAPTGIFKAVRGYEVWDKRTRKVLFLAKDDNKAFLAKKDDPLELEQFFPIPKPMQPLRRRRSIVPMVPYKVYKTLVAELDKTTKRISKLIDQLKVRGVYDNRMKAELERLRYCDDGQYEPVEDVGVFTTGGGGLEKAIAHWPMEEIVQALQQLYVQRDQIKQTIYEVTGLSDVLRGATNPNETLGAQQLKAQQGSTRLSQRQRMVADMCRDLLRMKAEIICNHYTPENLSAMTGIQVTPEVMQLLRNDMMRSYRIDIETDSTIQADMARKHEQMSLFLQGTAQYAQAMVPVLQLAPQAKAPVVQIYAAFARHFKLGKSAEDELDNLIEASQQPEEPQPSPEEMKAQAEQQAMQMEQQREEAKAQREQQAAQAKAQLDQQVAAAEDARKERMMQLELDHKERMAEIDERMKLLDLEIAREKAGFEREKAAVDLAHREETNVIDLDSRREKASMDRETAEAKKSETEKDDAGKALSEVAKQMQAIVDGIGQLKSKRSLSIQRDKDGRISGAVSA